MSKWEKVRLGDVATYINGFAFKPSDWKKEGLPIVRIQNLNNEDAEFNYTDKAVDCKHLIDDGDVLISWSASLGVYIWNRGKALLNQHIFKVVFDKREVDKTYFTFAIMRILDEIARKTHGSTMKHITKTHFDNTLIPLPPIDIQTQIARKLSVVSELLTLQKSQLEKMDQLIKSVFFEMFGDPVLNDRGWKKGIIGDLAKSINYGTSQKASTEPKGIPILRMNNITYQGSIDYSDLKYIALNETDKKKYLVHKGELLFNRTNSRELVGKTAVYKRDEPMAFAGYLIRLVPNEKANSEYISGYLNSSRGKKILYGMAKNIVGMANINAKEFSSIPIPMPPVSLQNKYADIVSKIEEQKSLVKQSIDETQRLFDSLMSKYFDD